MILPLLAAMALAQTPTPGGSLPKNHVPPKPKPDAVLAKVGGIPIRAADIEGYLWDWRAYEAIQDVITYQMISAEAKKQGVKVLDGEIQKELDHQLEVVKKEVKPGQTLNQLLLERGFPKSRLFLRIKSEQLLNRIVLKGFDPKKFVKVSTIVVRARSEQASELAQALQKAEAAYSALKSGEPWDEVLVRYVDDSRTIESHGMLGWRDLKAFPPTVQQEMQTLKPSGITMPAQTQNGIQIFRIEAFGTSADGATLEELKNSYLMGTRPKVLDGLKAKTKVDIFIGK